MSVYAWLLLGLLACTVNPGEAGRRRKTNHLAVFGVTCSNLTVGSVCNNAKPNLQFSNGCARCLCSAGQDACSTACPAPQSPQHNRKCAKLRKAVMKHHSARGQRLLGFTCPNMGFSEMCTSDNVGFRFTDGCKRCTCTGAATGDCRGSQACAAPTSNRHRRKCAALARQTQRRLRKSRFSRISCSNYARKFCRRTSGTAVFNDGCARCTCNERKIQGCQEDGQCNFFGTKGEMRGICKRALVKSLRLSRRAAAHHP